MKSIVLCIIMSMFSLIAQAALPPTPQIPPAYPTVLPGDTVVLKMQPKDPNLPIIQKFGHMGYWFPPGSQVPVLTFFQHCDGPPPFLAPIEWEIIQGAAQGGVYWIIIGEIPGTQQTYQGVRSKRYPLSKPIVPTLPAGQ